MWTIRDRKSSRRGTKSDHQAHAPDCPCTEIDDDRIRAEFLGRIVRDDVPAGPVWVQSDDPELIYTFLPPPTEI
jgi:hypothetical protein